MNKIPKPDTWMPLYVSDYLSDTSHLSVEQHGAYLLLLMHAWTHQGRLPVDDARLMRICRMNDRQWRRSREDILAFFYEDNGALCNRRLEVERNRAQQLIDQRSAAGKASAESKKINKNQRQNINDRFHTVATENTTSYQRNVKPSPSHSPTPSQPTESFASLKTLPVSIMGEESPIPPLSLTPLAPSSGRLGKVQEDTALQDACKATWHAYGGAYLTRYGTEPVRNAKVNANVKAFVRRLGFTESPMVAAWFLSHPGAFYVQKCHDFGCLLADAEKLRTEWATGTAMTQSRARQSDRAGATAGIVSEILNERRANG